MVELHRSDVHGPNASSLSETSIQQAVRILISISQMQNEARSLWRGGEFAGLQDSWFWVVPVQQSFDPRDPPMFELRLIHSTNRLVSTARRKSSSMTARLWTACCCRG